LAKLVQSFGNSKSQILAKSGNHVTFRTYYVTQIDSISYTFVIVRKDKLKACLSQL